MITGFNTDIEFQGTIYHVQTEDKGVKTPLILSLVYDRGTILASKRSAYNDLLVGVFDEKILAERLQKQHNLICAAVRNGRIEDLKRMAAKEAASKQQAVILEKEIKPFVKTPPSIEEKSPINNVKTHEPEVFAETNYQKNAAFSDRPRAENTPIDPVKSVPDAKNEFVSKPAHDLIWDVPVSVVEETIIEAVQIVEEDLILSAEAVEIITDYPEDEPIADTKLKVRLLKEEKFKSGDRKTLRVLVHRGKTGTGLGGTQLIIKILGSAFSPQIFHAKTDAGGIATVHLQMPQFKAGRAAILIKALRDGEEADLRRAITHD